MSKARGQAKQLLAQREILAAGLPSLAQMVRGSLVTRYRRCGKPTCHCVKSRGHGPAHYLVVTLKPGKTEQILLSEEMLPVARQFLDNYKRWWAAGGEGFGREPASAASAGRGAGGGGEISRPPRRLESGGGGEGLFSSLSDIYKMVRQTSGMRRVREWPTAACGRCAVIPRRCSPRRRGWGG